MRSSFTGLVTTISSSPSILLLALSQLKGVVPGGTISIVGIWFGVAWFVIQDRSSRYIGYYKRTIQELDTNKPFIFPQDLRGRQMRHVAYVLPVIFILMWLTILVAVLTGANA